MAIVLGALLSLGVVVFLLFVRAKDLPAPEPVSPFQHLDERKAAIYENLRDLQFEYRVGKLSDEDYQQTKRDLQRELAGVMGEIDRLKAELAPGLTAVVTPPSRKKSAPKPKRFVCTSCGAEFPSALKFCGECGKPMEARA